MRLSNAAVLLLIAERGSHDLLTPGGCRPCVEALRPSLGSVGSPVITPSRASPLRSLSRKHQPAIVPSTPAPSSTRLWGILDEIMSDSYDLVGSAGGGDGKKGKDASARDVTDAYEMVLAELVFSTNDPRVDIVNKMDLVGDPEFLDWMQNSKIEPSKDPEERVALRDLHDMIVDVRTKMEVNRLADERRAEETERAEEMRVAEAEARAEEGRGMSASDILRKATAIQTQTSEDVIQKRAEKKSFLDQELTPEIRLSYEGLLKKVLPPYPPGVSFESTVFKFYDQFDAQFVKLLNERAAEGDADSVSLLDALAGEQQKRIAAATEALKEVLSLGDPMRMEGALVKLAREGRVNEAFLLLLEANESQARSAGAAGPAQLMGRLRKRAIDEKDKQAQSKEIRLLRRLLRTDDPYERERVLEEAFTPKQALLVPGTMENAQKAADGDAPDQEKPLPDVPPPDFINACKAVLLNFGNLGSDDAERGDLASRIKKLAAEAEVVATRIYGKGVTLREQQDRMWSEQTTSIFDLERMEIEAERQGDHAPWTNPDSDDMFMPGFDSQGRMQIGGT
jgi:hypothetical protein